MIQKQSFIFFNSDYGLFDPDNGLDLAFQS